MLNEVVSYIEQCLRSHLNPRCKPVFVSFRPSRPPPQFYLLVSVSPTDVFLSPLFFPPSFPLISPLFRTFYLLYRLGRGPSVLLRGSFPIVEPARHYVAAPPPLRTSCIAGVSTAQRLLHRGQHRAPTAILFGHDNTLLRKLIILVVGVFRVIFGSTTHFMITFTAVISCAPARAAPRMSYIELYPAICSELRREDYFASVR